MPRFKSFNNDDFHLQMLLARSKNRYVSTAGFGAHWLISGGIGSAIWETISPNGTPLTVSFKDPLPDGTLLSDQENKMLLETIRPPAGHTTFCSLKMLQVGWFCMSRFIVLALTDFGYLTQMPANRSSMY